MQLSKSNQLGRYGKKAKRSRKRPTVKVKESGLQRQLNDTLDAYHIKFLRIENRFWSWLKANAPDEIFFQFCETFKGMPDNICMIPIGEKYNLCMAVEEKTERGKLNKDQKAWAKEIAVQVLRSTEENENAVIEFVTEAERMKNEHKL